MSRKRETIPSMAHVVPGMAAQHRSERSTRAAVTRGAKKLLQGGNLSDTVHGRRWRGYIAANAWTLDTMPIEKLQQMVGVLSKGAVGELLPGTTWKKVAKRLGVPENASATTLRALHTPTPRATLTAEDRAAKQAARLAEFTKKKEDEQRAQEDRPLVDDRAQAVPLDTLPVGARFKTPDDVRIGVPGVISRVVNVGAGGVSIAKTARLGDYIARGTMVVRLDDEQAGAA